MKKMHIHGQAGTPSAEEREQARLIAGFAYFENGKAKFPEAYNELIYSIAVTAYHQPEAFCNFLANAQNEPGVTPQQWLELADSLEAYAVALQAKWKESVSQG